MTSDRGPAGGHPPEPAAAAQPGPVDDGRRSYVVADVEPLDVTGTRTVTVGLVIWALAFVALLPFYGTLRDDGRTWWLWVCLAGVGLGLLGREYCRRREQRLRAHPREPESSPLGAAGL